MEGDVITLTCTTSGSKPAANIRWFRNDKEVQGKHVVWISQSVVSSVSTCAIPETSLLSNRSAAVLLCARILALFHCLEEGGGVTWCHDLPGSWPTLLLLLEALGAMPGLAQSCPLPGRGVWVSLCWFKPHEKWLSRRKKVDQLQGFGPFLDFSFKNEANRMAVCLANWESDDWNVCSCMNSK